MAVRLEAVAPMAKQGLYLCLLCPVWLPWPSRVSTSACFALCGSHGRAGSLPLLALPCVAPMAEQGLYLCLLCPVQSQVRTRWCVRACLHAGKAVRTRLSKQAAGPLASGSQKGWGSSTTTNNNSTSRLTCDPLGRDSRED